MYVKTIHIFKMKAMHSMHLFSEIIEDIYSLQSVWVGSENHLYPLLHSHGRKTKKQKKYQVFCLERKLIEFVMLEV